MGTSQSCELASGDAGLAGQDGDVDRDGELENQQPDDQVGLHHFLHALLEHVHEKNDADGDLCDGRDHDEGDVLVEVFGCVVEVALPDD